MAVLGAALVLAGCGSTQPAKTVTREVVTISRTQSQPEATPPPTEDTSCVIGPYESDVRVVFAGQYATSYCNLALHRWSGENQLWEHTTSLLDEPVPGSHPVEVCNLVKGNISAAVETLQGADQSEPTAICGRLVHLGWEESSTE
jgi:hypothetical protein